MVIIVEQILVIVIGIPLCLPFLYYMMKIAEDLSKYD